MATRPTVTTAPATVSVEELLRQVTPEIVKPLGFTAGGFTAGGFSGGSGGRGGGFTAAATGMGGFGGRRGHGFGSSSCTGFGRPLGRRGTKKLVKRTLVLPAARAKTRELFWLPSCELDRCFEQGYGYDPWNIGHVADFDDAIESYMMNCCEEFFELTALRISEPADALHDCGCVERATSDAWGDVPRLLLELRDAIYEDPVTSVNELLDVADLGVAFSWCGMTNPPTTAKLRQGAILAAFGQADARHRGLAAAAVDYMLQFHADRIGAPGADLAAAWAEIEEEDYVRGMPDDAFIFDVGLHDPCDWFSSSHGLDPILRGGYLVYDVDYWSSAWDLDQHREDRNWGALGILGWRLCSVMPANPPRPICVEMRHDDQGETYEHFDVPTGEITKPSGQ